MVLSPLLDNAIAISPKHIVLGNIVANFFKKRNIKTVSIILDFKNKSLILWGDDPLNTKATYRTGDSGYVIYYPGLSTYKSSGDYRIKRQLTTIEAHLYKYVDVKNLPYLAKPLNSNAVIIENVVILDGFVDTRKFYLSMKEGFFLMGNVKMGPSLKGEDLIKKSSINMIANATTSPTLVKTQLQHNTNTQTSSITPPKQSKTPSTTQTHIHLASPSAPSASAPSQIKNMSKPVSKPVSEPEPINDTEQVMSEADIKLENEYKKMILGE